MESGSGAPYWLPPGGQKQRQPSRGCSLRRHQEGAGPLEHQEQLAPGPGGQAGTAPHRQRAQCHGCAAGWMDPSRQHYLSGYRGRRLKLSSSWTGT